MPNILDELCIKHPYYLETKNFHSADEPMTYNDWSSFSSMWVDADVDMNLVFRWDMFAPSDEYPFYRLHLGVIQQRKGIYQGIEINNIQEKDKVDIVRYLDRHYRTMLENWHPFHNL